MSFINKTDDAQPGTQLLFGVIPADFQEFPLLFWDFSYNWNNQITSYILITYGLPVISINNIN